MREPSVCPAFLLISTFVIEFNLASFKGVRNDIHSHQLGEAGWRHAFDRNFFQSVAATVPSINIKPVSGQIGGQRGEGWLLWGGCMGMMGLASTLPQKRANVVKIVGKLSGSCLSVLYIAADLILSKV